MNINITNQFYQFECFIFRGNLALDFATKVEKYIDSSHSSFSIMVNENNIEDQFKVDKIFSIGKRLLKVTNNIDKTMGGIILNTYINCLLVATTTLYAGSSVFFNKSNGMEGCFLSICCFSMTALSLLRLIYHTNAGQYLASSMEKSLESLNELQMIISNGKQSSYVKSLKEDIRDKCTSPINPVSAFSLSNSTLIGTFATILTYLIVLIQFKAAEDEEKTKLLNDIHNMLKDIVQNQSLSH